VGSVENILVSKKVVTGLDQGCATMQHFRAKWR